MEGKDMDSAWIRLALFGVMMSLNLYKTEGQATNSTTATTPTNSNLTTGFNSSTTQLNTTTTAATTETTLTTATFDYDSLNFTTRNDSSTTENSGGRGGTTEENDYGNQTDFRVGGGEVGLDPERTVYAAITAGAIILLFALCYVGNMMNLCICRFLLYECPMGRYREESKPEIK